MPLYEVAILEKPTQKEAENGKTERLVLKPTAVVANDEQSAGVIAVMDNTGLELDHSRMEVLVRPFG